MPRRNRAPRREVAPDIKYNSELVARFINKIMYSGKKSTAQRIVYDAFDIIEQRAKRPGVDVFEQAIRNATPILEVKPRRVGGATYQVPVEVRAARRTTLAMRWVIDASRTRSEKSMALRLAGELLDAADNRGTAVKKKDDVHRMAEANKAFAHYRW